MAIPFTESDLEAYIDESLDPARANELEAQLKIDRELLQRLAQINQRRDAGVHTLSEIWRQNQIGVPTRDQMVGFVQGTIAEDLADYIHFRLEVLRCRFTNALHEDVESQLQSDGRQAAKQRQKKYIDSSAGLLRRPSQD
ncbi:MAG: hypothetical protein KF851_02215 [Pirellulaceae bacterium]|jgi:hypothetical protein|nr:hypothetical protein [Pirellulaceae bacterium]